MREYQQLMAKMKNKTITTEEKNRLFILAFGSDFMASNDKGKRKQYKEKF